MKFDIFGGTGFIGSKYCELYPDHIKKSRNYYNVSVDTTEILYFISTTNNYNIYDNPYIDIDTNLTTLIKVLESCKYKDVTFNFISSWFVYGESTTPKKESGKCNPKGFYSITKRTAELLLIEYCRTFNIKYRILRLCNVIGFNDSFSEKKNVLQLCISKLKNNEPVMLSGGGEFYRDYMFVDDTCKAINHIINLGETNSIYNVSSGKSYKFKDVIEKCRNLTNSSSKIYNIPLKEEHKLIHVDNIFLDNSKLQDLGFIPDLDFDEGLMLLCQ